ncbi:N-acetylglucosamine-6-phosphate deacetylase [Nonomuraea aridisoli]|uniref:N-acetylglucosamine-6-phosphate deacetylase n=1 Tax=Nonomuraea aridisoli TaxID=2070368 RepID=UPI0015E8A431|nr:amidohydrolase family protein [Nonomuraea aridisoli]
MIISGGRVLLPEGIRDDLDVLIDHGRIEALIPAEERGHRARDGGGRVDVGGRLVTPGLIDLHVHGFAGGCFDDGPGPAAGVLRGLAAQGVTAVQASLVSAPVGVLAERLAAFAAMERPADGARLLGVHLEGPFLAAAQCGAHDPAVLGPPSADDVRRLLDFRDVLGMVTLAPELPGAAEATGLLAGAGVIVAAGHSEARGDALRAAVDAGLTHITHLWSGQSSTVREGPWRVPGLLEESLAADHLTAEVIADGRHLPPALLEIARRCVGERLCVVSDGTPGTGLPRGSRYRLGTVTCEVGDGVGVVVGADAFGGSTSTLPDMLRHLTGDLGWPVAEAVAAATAVPARVLGLAHRKGAIAPGLDADLAVFDEGFHPWATVLRGAWLGPERTAP